MKLLFIGELNYLVKVFSFDMARLGVGLNRQDGRLNPVQPGADIVIPAGSDKMIFPIPTLELDAQQ
jgi:hypothetical protein